MVSGRSSWPPARWAASAAWAPGRCRAARGRPDSPASSGRSARCPLARCTVTCSRQVNDVAVSATPSSATVEPSTIVGRRNRVRHGTVTAVVAAAARAGCPVAQRFLDEPHRQVRQHAGDQQDSGALERSWRGRGRCRPARRSAAASATGTASRPSRPASPAGPAPAPGWAAASCRGCAGRPAGWRAARIISTVAPTGTSAHGPGNSLTPSISAPQDRMAASADRRGHGAQPHRPPDVGHQRADQRAEQQLPRPREAVVVGGGLVGLVGEDRVDERRDGQRAEQHDEERSAGACPAGGAAARSTPKTSSRNAM